MQDTSDTPILAEQEVTTTNAQDIVQDVEMVADDTSLAERRSRRMNRRLPARYRDILPQPPPPPLAVQSSPPPTMTAQPRVSLPVGDAPQCSSTGLLTHALRFFNTFANSFGLSRRYYGHRLPTHDPEDAITLQHLSVISPAEEGPVSAGSSTGSRDHGIFYPYPNRSSFLLGNWYWNGGIQKSKGSFKELIKIVGSPEFRPDDVNGTRWDLIDTQLRAGAEETGQEPFEGAGWTKTAVSIKVPFHKWTPEPGVYDYHMGDMYHRKLMSVIREKLANPRHNEFFHYQPYNLLWQRRGSPTPINVHGELYTSEAFLQAHQDLQQSPPEPGCELERVIVALMFWSDATQLTSFGNTKLWPCYMFFGNESKYRRCKPSCCLCSHVAYFNHVRSRIPSNPSHPS